MGATTRAQLLERLNEVPESVRITGFKIEYADKGGYTNQIEMIMKKKEIRVLRNFSRAGLEFKQGEQFTVRLLGVQTVGGFERYGDETMEGYLYPAAVVEFENGKIMHFAIDDEMHVAGDAE